jgi:hypothetical protein
MRHGREAHGQDTVQCGRKCGMTGDDERCEWIGYIADVDVGEGKALSVEIDR